MVDFELSDNPIIQWQWNASIDDCIERGIVDEDTQNWEIPRNVTRLTGIEKLLNLMSITIPTSSRIDDITILNTYKHRIGSVTVHDFYKIAPSLMDLNRLLSLRIIDNAVSLEDVLKMNLNVSSLYITSYTQKDFSIIPKFKGYSLYITPIPGATIDFTERGDHGRFSNIDLKLTGTPDLSDLHGFDYVKSVLIHAQDCLRARLPDELLAWDTVIAYNLGEFDTDVFLAGLSKSKCKRLFIMEGVTDNVRRIYGLDHLANCSLEKLIVKRDSKLNWNLPKCTKLSKSLQHLKFDGVTIENLDSFSEYGRLTNVDLESANVKDIDSVLAWKSLKNSTLQKISFGTSVNFDPLSGGQKNTDTVFALRRAGVEVTAPTAFSLRDPEPRSSLYILLGISCAGKTTLMGYMNELGCKNVHKISDRFGRLDDDLDKLILISTAEFKRRIGLGEVIAYHEKSKALYGIGFFELMQVKQGGETYFLDSSHPPSAITLAEKYDFVEPILMLSHPEVIEKRIKERELALYSVRQSLDYLESYRNMQERRKTIKEELEYLKGFRKYIDPKNIIEEHEDPFKKMKKIVGGSNE